MDCRCMRCDWHPERGSDYKYPLPTIHCNFVNWWRHIFDFCCCTFLEHTCDFKEKNICQCQRCHSCTFSLHINCSLCTQTFQKYISCHHASKFCDTFVNTHKQMSINKDIRVTQAFLILRCKCILCSNESINTHKDLDQGKYPSPTVLCHNLHYWLSQHKICCCQKTNCNCETCYSNIECFCPRCCKCKQHGETCENCKRKDTVFVPCSHYVY